MKQSQSTIQQELINAITAALGTIGVHHKSPATKGRDHDLIDTTLFDTDETVTHQPLHAVGEYQVAEESSFSIGHQSAAGTSGFLQKWARSGLNRASYAYARMVGTCREFTQTHMVSTAGTCT